MTSDVDLVGDVYWDACWNLRRTERLGEVFHDPYLHGRTSFDPARMAGIVDATVAAIPDLRVVVDDIDATGDTVVTRARFIGTHGGPLYGLGATGRAVDLPTLDVFWFREGKVWRYWHLTDHLPFLVGIGAEVRLGGQTADWDD